MNELLPLIYLISHATFDDRMCEDSESMGFCSFAGRARGVGPIFCHTRLACPQNDSDLVQTIECRHRTNPYKFLCVVLRRLPRMRLREDKAQAGRSWDPYLVSR